VKAENSIVFVQNGIVTEKNSLVRGILKQTSRNKRHEYVVKFKNDKQNNHLKQNDGKEKAVNMSDHILGFYFRQLAFGRLTFSYERLLANKTIGINLPVSLTYNPYGESKSVSKNKYSDVGFIVGVDINSYHDLNSSLKYYVGPRIRYGKDMLLGGIEGLTFQIQNGLFRSIGNKVITSVGVGFGFFKLSENYAARNVFNGKQVYPWGSISLRLGLRL